jgi:hypothetical protein
MEEIEKIDKVLHGVLELLEMAKFEALSVFPDD